MLQDRGDAQRLVSSGVNGAPPSAGIGQSCPAPVLAPRRAVLSDIGPAGSAGGATGGSIVTGIGDGGSPVPGEEKVPGPPGRVVADSSTGVAAGGGTASGAPGCDGGVLTATPSILIPLIHFLTRFRAAPVNSTVLNAVLISWMTSWPDHFFSGNGGMAACSGMVGARWPVRSASTEPRSVGTEAVGASTRSVRSG